MVKEGESITGPDTSPGAPEKIHLHASLFVAKGSDKANAVTGSSDLVY